MMMTSALNAQVMANQLRKNMSESNEKKGSRSSCREEEKEGG